MSHSRSTAGPLVSWFAWYSRFSRLSIVIRPDRCSGALNPKDRPKNSFPIFRQTIGNPGGVQYRHHTPGDVFASASAEVMELGVGFHGQGIVHNKRRCYHIGEDITRSVMTILESGNLFSDRL